MTAKEAATRTGVSPLQNDRPRTVAGEAVRDPTLETLAGLIRHASQCSDVAIFEYGTSTDDAPGIGRFATLSGAAPSSQITAMLQASRQAHLSTSGCFDAGRYGDGAEMCHVIGLRFSEGGHVFAGGYAVFRDAPDTQVWGLLHAITVSGARLVLAARKNRVQQRASLDGHIFQDRMLRGIQCGTDAYWETDISSIIQNVVVFPLRKDASVLTTLEGRSLPALLSSVRAPVCENFHDLHIALDTIHKGRIPISISGRTLADGTALGTARLLPSNQNGQLTPGAARSLIDKLKDAHQTEADLRREAELVLDGLSILTSGRSGREIFKDLLDLLGPALECRNAVVLQRVWSGRIAAPAATSDDLMALDWTDAGETLFAVDEVTAAFAVPQQIAIPTPSSGMRVASALCIKLKGGSKPALLLCLHEVPDHFGIRHLGLGTRLSLVASQAFIHEEERQRVVESAKLASIGEMAAGIVHEINQPLTSITLGVHNLLGRLDRGGAMDPDHFRLRLDRLAGQVERITKIVASMRVLARRSDGIDEPFSLDTTIRQAVGIAQHKLTASGIKLELSLCDEDATGNPLEFGQVILNLLTNAHDAILEKIDRNPDSKSDPRRITMAAAVFDEEWLEIIIRDTGCGFPADAVDHAFEAFATTKAPGKGTGLGLTLCRRIVENMQGTIAARNWRAGAEIRIRLRRSPGCAISSPEPP